MTDASLEGALWLPSDGHVDPAGLATALTDGARARGAKVLTGARIVAITVGGGRVRGVVVDSGPIACEVVVNAAGIWAAEVGRMVGIGIPVVPIAHQYLVTGPIDGVWRDVPVLRDPDRLVYFREEVGGLVVGGFERRPVAWGLDGIPGDFTHRLLPPDWERFAPLMEGAVGRIPRLPPAQAIRLVNGPEAYTPDGEFILGEASKVGGFFVAAGFCAHGIAGAGGGGAAVAAWVPRGPPPLGPPRMDGGPCGPPRPGAAGAAADASPLHARAPD